MRRSVTLSLPAALLLPWALLSLSWLQYSLSRTNLVEKTLQYGRIVLSSGEVLYPPDDPERDGSASHVLDRDPDSPAILSYPHPPPEGTHLLIDLALTHFPGEQEGSPPRIRRARELLLYNGPCVECDASHFRSFSRIKQARVEILYRRANNPDAEFLIPPAHPVWSKTLTLPDRPGPFSLSLREIPPPPSSPAYPEGVSYIIAKITILSVYPGERFPGRVALGEVLYSDEPYQELPRGVSGTTDTKREGEASLQVTRNPLYW